MLAKRGYWGCSTGSYRVEWEGIRRAGDFGKRPGPAWHGSGYRWKSGNRALILPILYTRQVRIAELFDSHYAEAEVISGSPKVNDTVELIRP